MRWTGKIVALLPFKRINFGVNGVELEKKPRWRRLIVKLVGLTAFNWKTRNAHGVQPPKTTVSTALTAINRENSGVKSIEPEK